MKEWALNKEDFKSGKWELKQATIMNKNNFMKFKKMI